MFKKFKDSPYARVAVVILVCGALLIVFNSWISNRQLSIGFKTINKTLAPLYIGVIFAFMLCPIYNACVRFFYRHMLDSSRQRGFSVGAKIVHESDDGAIIDSDQKRSILTIARAFASAICVVLVVGVVGLLLYFVIPQLIQTVLSLVNTLPQRLSSMSSWIQSHFTKFPALTQWADSITNAGTSDIITWAQEHILKGDAVNIAGTISSGIMTAAKYVLNAIIGLLIMVYLLNYKERLFAIMRKLVNATCGQKRKARLYEFAAIVNETFIGFIVGRIIDSFIIGVLTYITLRVCSIPFALMISVVVGVTNVIPFFGPFIGAVPSTLILMTEDPVKALYFLIIILVIQQLDGNVIGPKIVGNVIGISSFWVLISVLIGGRLFGFAGMALGVPVFAVIYTYIDKLMISSLKRKEKNTHTSYYYSLVEPYGIEDGEINLEPSKQEKSLFSRFRKERKDISQHKYAYDRNDRESGLDRKGQGASGAADKKNAEKANAAGTKEKMEKANAAGTEKITDKSEENA